MDQLQNIKTITEYEYPYLLKQISQLPEMMEIIGNLPPETAKYLCVVGSRSYSSYGKEACEKLISGLADYPIVIVSGLALGIDSVAHESALRAGLKTIAFPGSGLDIYVLYPTQHINLARRIVESGGTLLSPFKRNQGATLWTFPLRNRLMAGMCHATLIIEAGEKSGTLLTANNALEFGRDVLVIPSSIFLPSSKGSNRLLREGATAVTSSQDILEALGFDNESTSVTSSEKNVKNQKLFEPNLTQDEKNILDKLTAPAQRDELIRDSRLPAGFVNAILTELELKGVITEKQGMICIV